MADTPAPSRKGFSVSNPGMKEYLIVGAIALVGGIWYFRRQQSKATASQSQAAQGTPVVLSGAGGGGVPFGAFFAWLQNHQASPQVTVVNKTTEDNDRGDNDRKKGRGGKSATAPNVLGKGEAEAFSIISAAGWSGHVSGPVGSTVVSQTPGPGQKITQGQSTYWPVNQGKPTIDLGLN